jgi:hypothetical protein
MTLRFSTSVLAITLGLLLASLGGCATVAPGGDSPVQPSKSAQVATEAATPGPTSSSTSSPKPAAPSLDKGVSSTGETAKQLAYLIEEEKLAYDVYSAMFELWGSRVFGNIVNSEASHQSQVLAVMNAHKISDSRADQAGKFANKDLQKLYDELIAKGSLSAQDAYEVGVAIEELDIDDITKMLATAKDSDVISMMENLRTGSEMHLRAFNRQL